MYLFGIGFKSTRLKTQDRKKKIPEYIVDETLVRIGSGYMWIWVAIEPKKTDKFSRYISQKRENEKHVRI